MADERAYFTPGSADELVADSLKDGDVILISKKCTSLSPSSMLLCLASKFGISGDGKHGWDHAGLVYRDRSSNVPYLLEGHEAGVTLHSFEERLLQGQDHAEMLILPVRALDAKEEAPRSELHRFVQELGLTRTEDGWDGPGTCCMNRWAVYRDLRRGVRKTEATAAHEANRKTPCQYGAPLVVTALQRMGAIDAQLDPGQFTPAALSKLAQHDPMLFGRPISLRTLVDRG